MFKPRFALVLPTLLVGMLAPLVASATPPGPPGYTGKPNPAAPSGATCNSCHGASAKPTVTLTGPDTVAAGAVANYTLTVTGTATPRCVVAVTDGVELQPTSGNIERSFDELTPRTAGGAPCTFTLKSTKGGTIKLWYAGLSTPGRSGGGPEGIGYSGGVKTITVTGGTTPADAGASDSGPTPTPTDGGSSPTPTADGGAVKDSGSGTGTLPDGAAGPATRDPSNPAFMPTDEDGGCNAAGSPVSLSGLFGAASVAGVLLLARRRRRSA